MKAHYERLGFTLEAGCRVLLDAAALLPLAWDRYLLSLQPGSALLAAGVAVAAADHLAGAIGRRLERA